MRSREADRFGRNVVALACLIGLAGCVGRGRFHCDESIDGGPHPCATDRGEICVLGSCAVPAAADCPSGYRYDQFSGEQSSQCVGCDLPGAPCCGGACDGDELACVGGDVLTCTACGAIDEPCCATGCSEGVCAGERCSCVSEVRGGLRHSCALMTDGSIVCWGADDVGQLGIGDVMLPDCRGGANTAPCSTAPMTPVAGVYEHLGVGGTLSCGIDPTKQLACWGALYPNDPKASNVPVAIPTQDPVDEVAIGELSACTRSGMAVRCWGANDLGQLGEGTTGAPHADPPAGPIAGMDASQIAVGGNHACAVIVDRTVMCWGANDHGQLGTDPGPGNDQPQTCNVAGQLVACSPAPRPVPGLSDVVQLAAGDFGTCALTSGGAVWCWGDNLFGQLGGDLPDSVSHGFAQVQIATGIPLDQVTLLTVGGHHACAVRTDGSLWCWGGNEREQLGNGALGPDACGPMVAPCSRVPVQAIAAVSGTSTLSAGTSHTCEIAPSGTVMCWGTNVFGQLGDGSTALGSLPTQTLLGCP